MYFLDCYFYGALLGKEFPVNSYGPADLDDICLAIKHLAPNFNRMEVVKETRGMNPLPRELWWDVERPR